MNIVFVFLGIVFITLGLSPYLGSNKFWWWSKSTPIVPKTVVFGSIPIAFVLFLMAYTFRPTIPMGTRLIVMNYLGIPMVLVAIILTIWQPRWLKPKWLRWLETHHAPILSLLREEARKERWSDWNQRVSTQEGLEEWIEEVRHRYKLAHPDQRFIGDPHAK